MARIEADALHASAIEAETFQLRVAKLPNGTQVKIRNSVNEKLSFFPACNNIKALKGSRYGYRLRVGNWRVLFDFAGSVKIVSVQEVRKRDEHAY